MNKVLYWIREIVVGVSYVILAWIGALVIGVGVSYLIAELLLGGV